MTVKEVLAPLNNTTWTAEAYGLRLTFFSHATAPQQGDLPSGLQNSELSALYQYCSRLDLLIDRDYGQFGLKIYEVSQLRPKTRALQEVGYDLEPDRDWTIGEFLGVSEFLVFSLQDGFMRAEGIAPRTEWLRYQSLEEALLQHIAEWRKDFDPKKI